MQVTASDHGMKVFNKPPMENEINLIDIVRQLLIESGKNKEVIFAFDSHHFIQSAIGKNAEVQRHYLNRYWHLQLVSVSANSTDERYCLIPNGSVSDWLRLFKEKILPFIIEHNLPKVLHVG